MQVCWQWREMEIINRTQLGLRTSVYVCCIACFSGSETGWTFTCSFVSGFASKDKFAELCPFEEATMGETEKAPSFQSSPVGGRLWMTLPTESSLFLGSSVYMGHGTE